MTIPLGETAKQQHLSRPHGNDRRHPKPLSSGRHPRRRFLGLAAGAAVLPAVSRIAWSQVYPSRPITMIVPLPAGSALDTIGRVLAERLRRSLGQPVIIENVTGADGNFGTGRAAHARPDGYTIDLGYQGPNVLNGALYSLSYDVLNDLAPISPLATIPAVLYGRKMMPGKDLNDLIAWMKANPNKASLGSYGAAGRLLSAFFQKESETEFTLVPYRGIPIQDLVASQIDLSFDTPVSLALVRAGSIKAYAVTSDARLVLAPGIPTFAEMGLPALSYSNWAGLFAPKGTPSDIIGKLNAAAVEALADPAARSRLSDIGFEIFPRGQQTPEALGALQRADAEKWWPIIKELGIKPE
jgi:tripartite-type tricarboxylate transporter receptor subunit TctC